MTDEETEDRWGDTELTADNMSAPRLLNEANWKDFFHSHGYAEAFPLVMYAHEEANRLYSDLIAAAGAAQAPDRRPRLQVRAYTRFADLDGDEAVGAAWLVLEGLEAVDAPLRDDMQALLRSGTTAWLRHSYTMDDILPDIEWVDRLPPLLEAKDPAVTLSPRRITFRALIRRRG